MARWESRGRLAAKAGALTILLASAGCGGGTPSVSSTTAAATVHGTVKFKGEPVTGGNIRFDPSNIQRRSATIATAPIGKDGTYKVTTLQGANTVRFELPPDLLKKNPGLATAQKEFEANSADATLDIDLPQ